MLNYKFALFVSLSLAGMSAHAASLCDSKPPVQIEIGAMYTTQEQIEQAKSLAAKKKVVADANTTMEYSIEGNFFFEKKTIKSISAEKSPPINDSFPVNIALPINGGNTSIVSASQINNSNYKTVLKPDIVKFIDSINNNIRNGFTLPQGQTVIVSSSADKDPATKSVTKGYSQAQVDSSFSGGSVNNQTLSLNRASNLIAIVKNLTGLKAQFKPNAIQGSSSNKASDRYVRVEGMNWVKTQNSFSCVKHEMKPVRLDLGDCNKVSVNRAGVKGDSKGGPAGYVSNYLVPGDSQDVTLNLDFKQASGEVMFQFNPFSVPDRLLVEYGGKVYDSGYWGDLALGASKNEASNLKERLEEVENKGEISGFKNKNAKKASRMIEDKDFKVRLEGYKIALSLFGVNETVDTKPKGGKPFSIKLDPKIGSKMKAYVYGPLGTTKWQLKTQCSSK